MFQSKDFTLAGISNKDMGVIIVYLDTPQTQLGVNRTIKEGEAIQNIPVHFGSTNEPVSFSIQLSFVDKNENPIIPSLQHKQKVIEWLFPKDNQYKAFIPEENGLEYYIKFLNCQEVKYNNGLLLTLNARTNSPFCYAPENIITYHLNASKGFMDIEIDNKSNVDVIYKPIILFKPNPNNDSSVQLTVENKTTGDKFTIKNININEQILINCNRRFVFNEKYESKYLNMEGDFIRLAFGVNKLRLEGYGKLKIKTHFPMLML